MINGGVSKTTYFPPDPDAPYGRYYDKTPISENPSESEINNYFEFWIAMANKEQKEVLQAMFDAGIATEFGKLYKGKDDVTIVEAAIKWWDLHYNWEVKEFLKYIDWKKETLANPEGWTKCKSWKFQGAIPQRVKQLVMNANPELVKYGSQNDTKFQKIFFALFKKAAIGGN